MIETRVLSVNISDKKGIIKKPVDTIKLTGRGVDGDAHSGPWNRQVSLLGIDSIRKFEQDAKRKVQYGEFAENITTDGINLWETHPLDRFRSGELELEVTQIGKECHGTSCAIFKEVGNCVMPKEGIFARVVNPGTLKPGDILEYHPRIWRIFVVTLSDRAYNNEYEDKSGPRLRELITEFFSQHHQTVQINLHLIPDDPHRLQDLLYQAKDDLIDLVFTTGGTGIGPRDFTPDVVKPFLDKEIPGIMDAIRLKYGQDKPAALTSRAVAGVMGNSLIFTLPGSVKAVNEYLGEIEKNLMHLIYMLHGLDIH
jgi:molybdenum cofactor synthesis domain-containing protein